MFTPVLERDLAARAGLGFFGKNSMMISKEHGSFFMLGSLLINKKLKLPLRPYELDHCGSCTACLEVCPTDAIIETKRQIDASKCISTYTIEIFKDEQAPENYQNVKEEVFGCDLCQDVCPWNQRIDKNLEAQDYVPSELNQKVFDQFLLKKDELVIDDLQSMSGRGFRTKFKGSTIARTGRVGMLKNFKALVSK